MTDRRRRGKLAGWARSLGALARGHLQPFQDLESLWESLRSSPVDAAWYLEANPDVEESGIDPRIHFAVYGRREGRRPTGQRAPEKTAAPVEVAPSYPARDRWLSETPEVSIIILSFGKAHLTLACLDAVWRHTEGHPYEVVLVDNGSDEETFARLAHLAAPGLRLIRLRENRFFGEGNNLGAEAAKGRVLMFLNNDTQVTADWLPPMMRVFAEKPDAGCVGARLVYPDGRLQEAGALLDSQGFAVQRGKFGPAPTGTEAEPVDYCSAAALAVRRECFERVLGFDLMWEPAYYEDSDLCLKIAGAGYRTYYCPSATVVHHENATSADHRLGLALDNVVEINRDKFLTRWRGFLEDRDPARAAAVVPPRARPSKVRQLRRLGLYTPYRLLPGGGERYLLSIALAAREDFDVTLLSDVPWSRVRVLQLGRELGLDLADLQLATRDQRPHSQWDVFLAMGHVALPPIAGLGRRNLYHCQFPFEMDNGAIARSWGYLENYERVVVNSEYTRAHLQAAMAKLAVRPVPIDLVFPPVQRVEGPAGPRPPIVLSVGRFYAGGHPKRHDVLLRAFRALHQSFPKAELHLAGALHPEAEHRRHLLELRQLAVGLPVTFHLNPSRGQLEALYRRTSVYWHATGFGSALLDAEKKEHFGISIVEAMSARCVPVCYGAGGPTEIITTGANGFLFDGVETLVEQSRKLLAEPDARWVEDLRTAARARSEKYDQEHFVAAVRALLREPASAGAPVRGTQAS